MDELSKMLSNVTEAKASLWDAQHALMAHIMNCKDMPLQVAIKEGIVRFNFSTTAGFRRAFLDKD